MKKRIFAVLAIVMILVPLVVLSVSADQYDVVAGDVVNAKIEETIPSYATKTEYIKAKYGGYDAKSTSISYLVDRFSVLPIFENVNTFYHAYNDDRSFLSVGDIVGISKSYVRDMADGYTLNVLCGRDAFWSLGVNINGDASSSVSYFSGRGDVYITYRFDGLTDICLFDRLGVYDRVRIVFDGSEEANSTDTRGNLLDNLTIKYLDVRERDSGKSTKYENFVLMDYAFAFTDSFPTYNAYLLTALTVTQTTDMTKVADCWHYVDTEYEVYSEMRSLALEAAMDGYGLGYDDGYSGGEEYGYHSGYETGYQEGNESGYQTGKDDGYNIGFDTGYDDGYEVGNDAGYREGYGIGKDEGYREGMEYDTDMGSMFFSIMEAPIVLIDGMLDFNFFGINVAGLVKTLLTLSITAAIVFFIFKLVRG